MISFREVMKLQRFEFDVSDVIPTNAQKISPLVFFACKFYGKKNILQSFMVYFIIFHEPMNLQSFKWLNCVSIKVTSSTQMNINNMLIVACMYPLKILVNAILSFDEKAKFVTLTSGSI